MESLTPLVFRQPDPKKFKSDHNSSEKSGAGFPCVCTCGSNTRSKSQIETSKIEMGIAAMPLLLITCEMYITLMGDEFGRATDIDRLVLRTVYTKFDLYLGNVDFWNGCTNFRPKLSLRMVIWSFVGFLDAMESDSQTVRTCMCTIMPGQCLQFSNS